MSTAAADARGRAASTLLADLLELDPVTRRGFYRQLDARDMGVIFARCRIDLGSRFGLWQDDPVGFAEDVIGATLYSKQIEVLTSVLTNKVTRVPSTHAAAKTFTAALASVWWPSVYPVTTARVVTTAPRLRQVVNVLWPDIRRAHKAAQLPGEITAKQWKVNDFLVAEGFSAPDWDESATQGIHATHLLFIVDEAGGIGHTLGRAYAALMSQPHARELLIGNPPTDEEGSWFEEQSERADIEGQGVTIRISAYSTPNFTGETTGRCTSCPRETPPHRIATHLTPVEWVEESINEFGPDSSFVVARVHALFPTAIGQKVIPYAWAEAATEIEHEPAPGNWVRLGADLASEGGDEFVIARSVGYAVTIEHRSSGAANADQVNLAGRITQATREACELRDRLGDERDVHVKIDSSGLGLGTAHLVRAQVREMGLPARVLPVRGEDKPNDETQFLNARSEMWWTTRGLMKPATDPSTGQVVSPGRVKLVNAPTRLLAQLSGPRYSTNSSGKTVVERKKDTKKRIGGSPDLADAMNLCLYEPPNMAPASIERSTIPIPTGPQGRSRPSAGAPGQVIPMGRPRR